MKKFWISLFLSLSLLISGCQTVVLPEQPTFLPVSGEGLSVHYIDVGQADCALLECGGAYMLIDGGNVDDSDLVVTYLQQQGVQELQTVICTHAHEDHVGGLPAVLAVYPTQQVYSPTKTYSSRCFDDFMYYVDQQGLTITDPVPGDTFSLGEAQVTVLGPVKSYADTNNTSIVVKVVYGDTSFLFTGDMEKDAETDLLESGADVRADVLKVGHHGSDTSTGYRFLYEVDPDYAVISVGTGNSYGHPHKEPLERLTQAGVTQLRTDQLGTIVAFSDGTQITFHWDNQNADPQQVEKADTETCYIGNKNSKVVHTPSCGNLPAEQNRVTFDTLDDALSQGYRACSNCMG